MTKKHIPRYPIYVPSKGRFTNCLTAKFLVEDEVPFRLVVVEEEIEKYGSRFGHDRLLVLPSSVKGLMSTRNWIKDHSIEEGHERHWQLDDNIRRIHRYYKKIRICCRSGVAFTVVEDFVDRYENVAISGMNYSMFQIHDFPPFHLNSRVYSCSLVLNSIPHRWRLEYNDDTDMCLQVLADGWCTIIVNAFTIEKMQTMLIKGGNTDELYQGDGRLKMSRSLERVWPGVVTTIRRFGRPQHHVLDAWRRFDTPLKRKPGIDFNKVKSDEYGMKLKAVKPIKSRELKRLVGD